MLEEDKEGEEDDAEEDSEISRGLFLLEIDVLEILRDFEEPLGAEEADQSRSMGSNRG